MSFVRARPLDAPAIVDYLNSIKAAYRSQPPLYLDFLNLIREWTSDSYDASEAIQLISQVSSILKRTPRLLRNFNCLLPDDIRIECSTDVEQVDLITIITTSSAHIYCVRGSTVTLPSPSCTQELQSILSNDDWDTIMGSMRHDVGSSIAELLQIELDAEVDSPYKRRAFRSLRGLAKKSMLPQSFFLHNVMREAIHPEAGGGFADIHKGRLDGKPVCLKVLRFYTTPLNAREKVFKSFCNELLVWRQLKHPNVLPLLGANKDLFAPSFCLISPWMEHGNIMAYLERHPQHNRFISVIEIVEGLHYLHELDPPIVHGDIKGANILVKSDLSCCLADFGLASVVESQCLDTRSAVFQGSVRWMAPELILPDNPLTEDKTTGDIHAFACTVYEIYTGHAPFPHLKRDAAVMQAILAGERPKLPSPEVWSMDMMPLWHLLESCWAKEADVRPRTAAIREALKNIKIGTELFSYNNSDCLMNEPAQRPDVGLIRAWLRLEFADLENRNTYSEIISDNDHDMAYNDPRILMGNPPSEDVFTTTSSPYIIQGSLRRKKNKMPSFFSERGIPIRMPDNEPDVYDISAKENIAPVVHPISFNNTIRQSLPTPTSPGLNPHAQPYTPRNNENVSLPPAFQRKNQNFAAKNDNDTSPLTPPSTPSRFKKEDTLDIITHQVDKIMITLPTPPSTPDPRRDIYIPSFVSDNSSVATRVSPTRMSSLEQMHLNHEAPAFVPQTPKNRLNPSASVFVPPSLQSSSPTPNHTPLSDVDMSCGDNCETPRPINFFPSKPILWPRLSTAIYSPPPSPLYPGFVAPFTQITTTYSPPSRLNRDVPAFTPSILFGNHGIYSEGASLVSSPISEGRQMSDGDVGRVSAGTTGAMASFKASALNVDAKPFVFPSTPISPGIALGLSTAEPDVARPSSVPRRSSPLNPDAKPFVSASPTPVQPVSFSMTEAVAAPAFVPSFLTSAARL